MTGFFFPSKMWGRRLWSGFPRGHWYAQSWSSRQLRATQHGPWEVNVGPPGEQQALLTPEPPRLRCTSISAVLVSVCSAASDPPCLSPASLSHWPFASMKYFYIPNTVEASLLARNADPNTNTVMYRVHEESYRSLSAVGNSCIGLGMVAHVFTPGLRKLEIRIVQDLVLVWVSAGPIKYHDPKRVGRRV